MKLKLLLTVSMGLVLLTSSHVVAQLAPPNAAGITCGHGHLSVAHP